MKFWTKKPKKQEEVNYLLTCIGTYDRDAKKIIGKISKEILPIVTSPNVKYYNNPTTIIFHFRSNVEFEDMKEFISSAVSNYAAIFYITKLVGSNSFISMPKEIADYLGNLETATNPPDLTNQINDIVDTEIPDDVIYDMYEELKNEIFSDEVEDGDLEQILRKNKKVEKPTLDFLLDKISTQGISSLTKEELELLEIYSKGK